MRIVRCTMLALGILALAGHAREPALYDRAADRHAFTIFMREGGWCWYQDPRAIAHGKKLFIGSVRGNGQGAALVGIYDLKNRQPLGTATMRPQFDRDDHNSPVFYGRRDGSVLATYARHHQDLCHYSRISDPDNPMKWSDEASHPRMLGGEDCRVTYMNLYFLEQEGLLYNFFRGMEFNPTFVTSPDEGKTWSEPVHFFKSEAQGDFCPYPRYASNGKDTVCVSITDDHPRNFGNSIYYFEFRKNRFFRADGSTIKDLAQDGPLKPSEAELIYRGSMTTNKSIDSESVPGAAWTSSIAVDRQGRPHIAYTLHHSNADHRYRLASWDGAKWIDREVACGGKCLYAHESSYTGLITLDPVDPTVVFISADVDPSTGRDTGGKHEIYRAKIGLHDGRESIRWKLVTSNSPVMNIRPVVVRDGNVRVILWNRGEFKSFIDYQLDTVGQIEKADERRITLESVVSALRIKMNRLRRTAIE